MKNPEIIGKTVIGEGRFLRLCNNLFTDEEGRERSWESVERTNSSGAVMIAAFLRTSRKVLFVRQFRPPAGKYMIEFPAGLIENGETAENTAVRELYEETGFCGSIEKVIPPAYNSPGMSGETVTMVIMNIDKTQYPEMPENHQEASEDIETIVVSRSKLAEFVAGAVERGDGIDARIAVFAAML